MYPIVGAFRALVKLDGHKYGWKKPPIAVWDAIGSKLTSIILDEKMPNPDVIAKNNNLWSNLLKEVYIYGFIQK